MRILVIGGTGFIGPDVVTRLHNHGHAVTLFHRGLTEAALPIGIEHIRGDRRDLPAFVEVFKRLGPDLVLDMFPFSEQDAKMVMTTFQGIARRVVAVSSQDVYRAYGRLIRTEPGPRHPVPLTETSPLREKLYPHRGETLRSKDDPLQWQDDYDKILVERTVMRDPELPGTILRLPMVYGPRDRQHRLFEYLKRMDDRRPAILLDKGLANWRWTRGYVENVAAAIALAASDERAAARIYNVGEVEALSTAEWVKQVGEVAGWPGRVVVVPKTDLPAHLAADFDTGQPLVAETSRIRNKLGYREPVPFREGLQRTIAWERTHPPEEIDAQAFDYAAEDAALGRLK